jgi:hypothetical protein
MTEVYFRGEWMDKSHANLILERESRPNTPEYKQKLIEEEERKKQQKQRQQEQKQKRADSRLKDKKI